MLALSENLIIAQNSLRTRYPWLLLAELAVGDDADTYHRWVQDHDDLVTLLTTYGGNNVVAHWKLNDNAWSTLVADASGNGNHGLANKNTVHLHTNGKIGGAFDFDGSSDYTDCNNPFESTFQGSHAISIWINPDEGQPGTIGSAFGAQTSDTDLVKLYLNTDGRLAFNYLADDNGLTLSTDEVIFDAGPGKWTHVVCVLDATIEGPGGIKIYVDGALAGSGNTSGITSANYTSVLNPFIGALNFAGINTPFDGAIDNVMLFSKALTAADVTALYNSGSGTEMIPAKFSSFNFDLDQVTYKGGEMPKTTLRLSNVTQFIKSDLENNRGCTSSEITLRIVHANQLYEDYSELDVNFEVIYPRITAKYVEFAIGGPSPLKRRFPLERFFCDACRYVSGFKTDPRCGYSGAATSCSGLRSRCRELSNEANFGGFPGLRPETMQLA